MRHRILVVFPVLAILFCAIPLVLASDADEESVKPQAAPAEQAGAADSSPADDAAGESAKKQQPSGATINRITGEDPGVSMQTMCTNCNNADLSVGGMGNEHVSIICDGMPVGSGLAQIYLLSIMPGNMIDRVAVKKGASNVELEGHAIGGAIEIERRSPVRGLQFNTSADTGEYGWRGTKIDLSGKSGRFGGNFIGSWATQDRVDANDDGNPNLPSFDRYTLEGNAEIDTAKGQRLRLNAMYYDETQEDGPAAFGGINFFTGEPVPYDLEDVDLERRQYGAIYDISLRNGSRINIGASWSDRSMDIREGYWMSTSEEREPTYFIDETRGNASVDWFLPIGLRSTLRAGASISDGDYGIVDVDYNFNVLSIALPIEEALAYEQNEEVRETGVWVEGETALGGDAELTVGVRYVDFSYSDAEEEIVSLVPGRAVWLDYGLPEGDRVLPRASVIWKPTDPLQLRFSAGLGYRSPDPIYEEVCCGRKYRGNRGIVPERSQSLGVETIYQPTPRFRLGGSVFLTDFDDLVIKIATLSFQYTPTYQNVNVPEARYLAAEINTKFEATDWFTVKASYSVLDADNRTPDDTIPTLIDFFNVPEEKDFFSDTIPYVAEDRGSIGFQFTPDRWGLNVGIDAQYTGKFKIQYFDASNIDLDFGSDLQDEFVDSDDHWTVNLNFSKTLKYGLTVYGGVDNLNDYVQADLGYTPFLDDMGNLTQLRDYNWGPLRGRYVYGGVSYQFAK